MLRSFSDCVYLSFIITIPYVIILLMSICIILYLFGYQWHMFKPRKVHCTLLSYMRYIVTIFGRCIYTFLISSRSLPCDTQKQKVYIVYTFFPLETHHNWVGNGKLEWKVCLKLPHVNTVVTFFIKKVIITECVLMQSTVCTLSIVAIALIVLCITLQLSCLLCT